jgi:fused signal recognition particle receptor
MLFKSQGKKVLIAACDTFRAAASKQLAKWAYSVDVQIVKHHEGGDPAAVLYDAIDAALSRKMDILIVDTAGRFHNRQNLMQELAKLNKVIDKKAGNCNRQNLLVLDANTGHNAFVQASEFSQSVPIHGIIMAKLDSTAKGGIILPISNKLKIPVYFAGIGEKAEDLIEFDRKSFINSVF